MKDDSDILCLAETWGDDKRPFAFDGFTVYEKNSKKLPHTKGRYFGGVSILIKNSPCISHTKFEGVSKNVLFIVFTKPIQFVLAVAYRPPESSPYQINDFFPMLEADLDCIMYQKGITEFTFMGDWNGRIGELNSTDRTLSTGFRSLDLLPADEYTPDSVRASKDHIVNRYGEQLISFIAQRGYTVLNGHPSFSDSGGEFTYAGHGASCVDFCFSSDSLFVFVNDFRVGSSSMSDHFPLILSLHVPDSTSVPLKNDNDDDELECPAPKKFILSKEDKEKIGNFSSTLMAHVNLFVVLFVSLGWVKPLLALVTASFLTIAEQFKVKLPRKKNVWPNKPIWYNKDCDKLRKKFGKALRSFRRCRTAHSLESFLEAKKDYNSTRRSLRDEHLAGKKLRLEEAISNNDSKTLWSLIKQFTRPRTNFARPKISMSSWVAHFNKLLNQNVLTRDEWKPEENANEEKDATLDSDIGGRELLAAVDRTRLNKAAGHDGLNSNIFKWTKQFTSYAVLSLFNLLFKIGYFPSSWVRVIISPLYKGKGCKGDPANYRGIALMPVIGKIFASILNDRLMRWANEKCLIDDRQAGFRPGYSTIDNVFVLDTVITQARLKSKTLYLVFFDLKSCFDKVNREALLFKLTSMGTTKKMVRILRSFFSSGSFVVKSCDKISDSVEYTNGLYQGSNLSPLLFSLFINDLFQTMDNVDSWSPKLDGRNANALLYADDACFASYTILGLQRMINAMETYCDHWGLEVNCKKTVIMVCKGSQSLRASEKWFYKGEKLKTVGHFKYLGVNLAANGKWYKHAEASTNSGKRGVSGLSKFFWAHKQLPIATLLKIFDGTVLPAQLYGAEIWGTQDGKIIDKINTVGNSFNKMLLGLPSSAPTTAVNLDLKRTSTTDTARKRAIDYWLKLTTTGQNRILSSALTEQRNWAAENKDCWGLRMQKTLQSLGFGEFWTSPPHPDNHSHFKSEVAQRITDHAFTSAFTVARNLPSLRNFLIHKTVANREMYAAKPIWERRIIAIFRMNCQYSLPISRDETVVNKNRCVVKKCKLCGVVLKNPWIHFLYYCDKVPGPALDLPNRNWSDIVALTAEEGPFLKSFLKRGNDILNA